MISVGIESERYIEEDIVKRHQTCRRIGQISYLPQTAMNIKEDLFGMYHQKTRNAIRKGLAIQELEKTIDSVNNLDIITSNHQKNMIKLGGKQKKLSHFQILKEHSGKEYKVRTAVYHAKGEAVCGILALVTESTYEYFTPFIKEEYRNSQLLSRLIFEEMEYASKIKLKNWNWGGTWPTQEGVHRFKSRWGAQERLYSYLISENTEEVRNISSKKKMHLSICINTYPT